jgi:hypothetical protein
MSVERKRAAGGSAAGKFYVKRFGGEAAHVAWLGFGFPRLFKHVDPGDLVA